MTAIVGIDASILYVSTDTLIAQTLGAVIEVSITIGNEGTGYSIDDVLTISSGGADCEVTVNTIGGSGEVQTFTITTPGTGYVEGDDEPNTPAPAGGSGCLLNIDKVSNSITIPTWDSGTKLWTLGVNNSAYDWEEFTERNEINITVNVDTAEHKVFVANVEDAWVTKARLYMNWNGSISGYYDDANDIIFETMKNGKMVWLYIVNTKEDPTKYWLGSALLTTVDSGIVNEDFTSLDVDFEGSGPLYRSQEPSDV